MPVLIPGWHPKIQLGNQYAVDWAHPISYGLSYVNVTNNFNGPIYTNNAVGALTLANIALAPGPGGIGFGGTSADTGRLKWNKAPKLAPAGTILCYTTPDWLSTNNLIQFLFRIDAGSDSAGLLFFNSGTSGWWVGWYNVTGAPFISNGPVSGSFVQYKPAIFGCTWNNTAKTLAQWIDGKINGTGSGFAGAVWPDTSSWNLSIGNAISANYSWNDTTTGQIYWLATWDRVLSDSELVYINANPMCFLVPAEYEMPMLYLPSAGFIPGWATQSNLPVIGAGTY